MTLESLSRTELLTRFGKLVRTERKITHLILECIAEIDRRKLFLEMAFPSLFELLTKSYGYSAGAAQRRISAARLMREVPEVAVKIEKGTLNLSQIAVVSQSIKLAEKTYSAKMDAVDKLELIEKIETRGFAETQQILAQELKIEAPAQEKVQHHGDGSVTITMTLSAEQYADWCRAGELVSHSVPNGKYADLAGYLARKEIVRRTEIKRASSQRLHPSTRPRQIRPNLRKQILMDATEPALLSGRKVTSASEVKRPGEIHTASAAPGCSYTNPFTGKLCGSRRFLQIEHRRPVSQGGSNEAENLTRLCGAHNRWRHENPD